MGYSRSKKKENCSQIKDAGFFSHVQNIDRESPSHGTSFVSVPDWEKRFCSQMKWKDFCKGKSKLHYHSNVLDWDDTAGKEAFDVAKARYWAEMNNLPFEIPLPDPDMHVQEVDDDAYIDPSLFEGLKKSRQPPQVDPNTEVIPTGWDVPPADVIPEFIFIPSTADGIVGMSAPIIPAGKTDINDESLTIIPTGWGDEEDSQSIKAWDLQGRRLKGASTLNNTDRNVESMFGIAENHIRGWKQDRRNGDMFSGETINAWEHHQHRNGARDRRHGRRGGGGSNHANLRCHEKDYLEYNRMKSIKEKYFWRQKSSFDRGLSCTPENH